MARSAGGRQGARRRQKTAVRQSRRKVAATGYGENGGDRRKRQTVLPAPAEAGG